MTETSILRTDRDLIVTMCVDACRKMTEEIRQRYTAPSRDLAISTSHNFSHFLGLCQLRLASASTQEQRNVELAGVSAKLTALKPGLEGCIARGIDAVTLDWHKGELGILPTAGEMSEWRLDHWMISIGRAWRASATTDNQKSPLPPRFMEMVEALTDLVSAKQIEMTDISRELADKLMEKSADMIEAGQTMTRAQFREAFAPLLKSGLEMAQKIGLQKIVLHWDEANKLIQVLPASGSEMDWLQARAKAA